MARLSGLVFRVLGWLTALGGAVTGVSLFALSRVATRWTASTVVSSSFTVALLVVAIATVTVSALSLWLGALLTRSGEASRRAACRDAVRALLRVRPELDARAAARELGVLPSVADAWLTELAVAEEVQVDVAEGAVRYRVAGATHAHEPVYARRVSVAPTSASARAGSASRRR